MKNLLTAIILTSTLGAFGQVDIDVAGNGDFSGTVNSTSNTTNNTDNSVLTNITNYITNNNVDTRLLSISAATVAVVYTVDHIIDWYQMIPKPEAGDERVIYELLTEEEVKAAGEVAASMRVMKNCDNFYQDIIGNVHVSVWVMEGRNWNYHLERLWNLATDEQIYSQVKVHN